MISKTGSLLYTEDRFYVQQTFQTLYELNKERRRTWYGLPERQIVTDMERSAQGGLWVSWKREILDVGVVNIQEAMRTRLERTRNGGSFKMIDKRHSGAPMQSI